RVGVAGEHGGDQALMAAHDIVGVGQLGAAASFTVRAVAACAEVAEHHFTGVDEELAVDDLRLRRYGLFVVGVRDTSRKEQRGRKSESEYLKERFFGSQRE